MGFRGIGWGAATLTVGIVVAGGCGGEVLVFGEGVGDGGAGGTATGQGGTSSGTATGTATGTGSGTAAGTSTGVGMCEVDCSQIAAPPCSVAVCDEASGQCEVVPEPVGVACDDGLFCTTGDACDGAGTCVGGADDPCGIDPGPCEQVTCNEASQTCTVIASGNGTPCTSPDLCIVDAVCQNGACVGPPKDCFGIPLPGECYQPVCDPMDGMCKAVIANDGQPCSDPADLCTDGKVCQMGSCVGGFPKDCSGLSVGCNLGVCNANTGQCVQQPVMPGAPCAEGTDDCNQGICDASGACLSTPINEGNACDDGLTCTSGTSCTAGVCGGGTTTVTDYFFEDFSDNAAGWTLDMEWQIGPAMTSSGQTQACGASDPAVDHTPGNDNGIAGVQIGGNANPMLYPYYWLTSPVVNTAGASSLFLELWRWLNSDYTPYMQNRIDVFDGTTWVTVFETGGPPITNDTAWTPQSFDISAYANPLLQVRFGFEIGNQGVWTCSSWNLDDVALRSGACL